MSTRAAQPTVVLREKQMQIQNIIEIKLKYISIFLLLFVVACTSFKNDIVNKSESTNKSKKELYYESLGENTNKVNIIEYQNNPIQFLHIDGTRSYNLPDSYYYLYEKDPMIYQEEIDNEMLKMLYTVQYISFKYQMLLFINIFDGDVSAAIVSNKYYPYRDQTNYEIKNIKWGKTNATIIIYEKDSDTVSKYKTNLLYNYNIIDTKSYLQINNKKYKKNEKSAAQQAAGAVK